MRCEMHLGERVTQRLDAKTEIGIELLAAREVLRRNERPQCLDAQSPRIVWLHLLSGEYSPASENVSAGQSIRIEPGGNRRDIRQVRRRQARPGRACAIRAVARRVRQRVRRVTPDFASLIRATTLQAFALEPRLELGGGQLLQVGLRRAHRTQHRDLGAGRGVDGRDLHPPRRWR